MSYQVTLVGPNGRVVFDASPTTYLHIKIFCYHLLTYTTFYCIIGTEVHELLFLVYRNSCSLSSRLYKKNCYFSPATFPSGKKQQNIPHGGMT